MSTQASGRVVDAASNPLAGLQVQVTDVSALFDSTLAGADTAAEGSFTTSAYDADSLSGHLRPSTARHPCVEPFAPSGPRDPG